MRRSCPFSFCVSEDVGVSIRRGARRIPTNVPSVGLLRAERRQAHGGLDTLHDQLLELGLARLAGAVLEGRGIVAQRGQPGTAAVVVLAPGDRVELAVARVAAALRGQRVLVDGGEE